MYYMFTRLPVLKGIQKTSMRFVPWVMPLGLIAGYVAFPALTDDFKRQILGFDIPVAAGKSSSNASFDREEFEKNFSSVPRLL